MLKIITLSLVTLLTLLRGAEATPLTGFDWGDAQLENCMKKLIKKQNWQSIEDVTEVKCHSKKILSAQNLSKLANLRKLSLFNNKIKQLDLAPLIQLETLNLAKNKLTDLNITGLSKLKKLYLFNNKLVNLKLSGLVNLEEIRLMQNSLETLDIRPLGSLKQGHIFDNQLEDLSIEGLSNLEFLDVRQNPMPDKLYDFYDEQEGIVISHDGNADDWK